MQERAAFVLRRAIAAIAESVLLQAQAAALCDQASSSHLIAVANRVIAKEIRARSPRKAVA